MATSEPAKAKTDVIADLAQKARLQTTFSNQSLEVCHTVRDHTEQGSLVREHWKHENYIRRSGLGSVDLQKCNDVEVLWDDYEKEGDDRGFKDRIGSLRAVKLIHKPRDQMKLAGEFLSELNGLVSLTKPEVCPPVMPSLALATRGAVNATKPFLKPKHSMNTTLSTSTGGTRASERCSLRWSTLSRETCNPTW